MTLIPPIAVPVPSRRILSSVLSARAEAPRGFAGALSEITGRSAVDLYGSGRAALASLLASWREPERDEVVAPAYTCWSVAASAVRAGLKVRLVDVDPSTLDFDGASLDRVDPRRVVAFVGAHLFGRSCDVEELVRRARGRDENARVIEDSAQAWPASPSAADAVLLSFGRGKPLPLGGGGAVAHRGPSVATRPARKAGGWLDAASLLATTFLGRPALYRLPASLPFLGIGETVYDPAFDGSKALWPWQERLGRTLFDEIPSLQRARSQHARAIAEVVRGAAGWTMPAVPESPLRLPVLAPSRHARDAMLGSLLARGVSASAMYPGTLADIPELAPHLAGPVEPLPGARALADRLLTLPVYPALRPDEVAHIGRSFLEAVRA